MNPKDSNIYDENSSKNLGGGAQHHQHRTGGFPKHKGNVKRSNIPLLSGPEL
jgi:hypothetical protein